MKTAPTSSFRRPGSQRNRGHGGAATRKQPSKAAVPRSSVTTTSTNSQAKVPPGARRGIYGTTLTSSGLHALDEALGGGLYGGSMLIIKYDRTSTAAATALATYFVREGVTHAHNTLVLDARTDNDFDASVLRALPADLTRRKRLADRRMLVEHLEEEQEKARQGRQQQQQILPGGSKKGGSSRSDDHGTGLATSSKPALAARGGADVTPRHADPQLKIAWRYGRHVGAGVQKSKHHAGATAPGSSATGASAVPHLCHSYILCDRIDQEELEHPAFKPPLHQSVLPDPGATPMQEQSATQVMTRMLHRIQRVGIHREGLMSRVMIHDFGTAAWGALAAGMDHGGGPSRAALTFINVLRRIAARNDHCTIVVSIPVDSVANPMHADAFLTAMTHMADASVVLTGRTHTDERHVEDGSGTTVDGRGGSDRSDYDGHALLEKRVRMRALACTSGAFTRMYGYKLRRRKLLLEPLALPPEHSRVEAPRRQPFKQQERKGSQAGPSSNVVDF